MAGSSPNNTFARPMLVWLVPLYVAAAGGAFALTPPGVFERIGLWGEVGLLGAFGLGGLAIAAMAVGQSRRVTRALRESAMRTCPGCGYNLSGLGDRVACPECGRECDAERDAVLWRPHGGSSPAGISKEE